MNADELMGLLRPMVDERERPVVVSLDALVGEWPA